MRGFRGSSPREAGGGGPCEAWWRGNVPDLTIYPSTTLRVVPLPICDGEEP